MVRPVPVRSRVRTSAGALLTISGKTVKKAHIVRTSSSDFDRQITDVVDEMIPMMPVDDRMSALVVRLRRRILNATTEDEASYVILLAVASAEITAIMKERAGRESTSSTS
jgi:hypothetical protein